MYKRWGVLWQSKNQVDGRTERLLWDHGQLVMFRTRREARQFAHVQYDYIKTRPDLRQEPHGWQMPRPVKLISIEWIP